MNKLFDRIFWHNDTTPAINDSNLNSMSKAIDDIDDRVITLADDVMTVIPQIQAYLDQAEELVDALEELSQNPPYIGENGNWYVFNTATEQYEDSGIDASITVAIADVTALAPDAQPYVTNTGTDTDPIFHLFIPRGQTGAAGNGIASIAKTGTVGLVDTYTITFTDGTTTTFTVTNGSGAEELNDLTDVDIDTQTLAANDTLVYDGTKWVNGAVQSGMATDGSNANFMGVGFGENATASHIGTVAEGSLKIESVEIGFRTGTSYALAKTLSLNTYKGVWVDYSDYGHGIVYFGEDSTEDVELVLAESTYNLHVKFTKENNDIKVYTYSEGSNRYIYHNAMVKNTETTARGYASHAEGVGCLATSIGAHAEGCGKGNYFVKATSSGAHAEGYTLNKDVIANGLGSHAEGCDTYAWGSYSHSEGKATEAIGQYSHAEGNSTRTDGNGAHAEGDSTSAKGNYSHAEGYGVKALRTASFAHGYQYSSMKKFRGTTISEKDYSIFGFDTSGAEWSANTSVTDSQNGCSGTIINASTVTLDLAVQGMYLLICSSYTISNGALYGATARLITAAGLASGTPSNLSLGQSSTAPATIAMVANNKITIQNGATTRATQFTLIRVL